MKFIIMILIVLLLATTDFITGIIKGYTKNKLQSRLMRVGGLHKLSEIIIMSATCGFEVLINKLGAYYDNPMITQITGIFASIVVFGYIALMEIISILENFAEINPDAKWVKGLVKKLKNVNDNKGD